MTKAPSKDATDQIDKLKEILKRHELVFVEINRFTDLIRKQEEEIKAAELKVAETKSAHDKAKADLESLRGVRDGAKHSLYKYLAPGVPELYPLFDTMERPNEKKHGAGAKNWRKDPLAALKLSLPTIQVLNDGDIMLIGQLQDRINDDPESWWENVPGLTAAIAAAVVDRLNEFIEEQKDQ